MKLRIFTLVFKNRFLELLEYGCARSLAWPKNRAVLEGSVWDIYAHHSERERVLKSVEKVGVPVEFHDIPDIHDVAEKLQACLIDESQRCADGGYGLLTAQPDLVFGDGSIGAMAKFASEQSECCVAVPHPRVNDAEFVRDMPDRPISNQELVSMAFRHMHKSWRDADLSLDRVNCWASGVAWRSLGDGLYGVSSRLPTIFLARPTHDDVEILRKAEKGAWDHIWPETLVRQQRQRVIGSSDAAFVVELTEKDTHNCAVREKLPNQQDIYRYDLEHHRVNRNTVTVWRCG